MKSISFSKTNAKVGGTEYLSQCPPTPEIVFVPAWQVDDERIARDAVRYWHKHKLVREQEFEFRARQISGAVYAGSDLVGISTVEAIEWKQLRFLNYRCSIAPDFRRQELTWRLTAFTHNLLEKWSYQQSIKAPVGLLVTLQAREFASHMGPPVISKHGLDLIFVSRSDTGHQIRAIWFKHANCEATIGLESATNRPDS